MNILSIDFDYFQNVTREQLDLYPDGIDNSTSISEIIWGNHYADNNDVLLQISIMQHEFLIMKSILKKQNCNVPVLITNSHVHIYNFINSLLKNNENLSICNIDMHHDILNDNDQLDCGNWIGYIVNERLNTGKHTTVRWIYNPISLSNYGIENEMQIIKNGVADSLKAIKNETFDAIFLCRSDIWTPPHLDKYFSELCDLIEKRFSNITLEKDIDKPREKYLEIKDQIKDMYSRISSKNKE